MENNLNELSYKDLVIQYISTKNQSDIIYKQVKDFENEMKKRYEDTRK